MAAPRRARHRERQLPAVRRLPMWLQYCTRVCTGELRKCNAAHCSNLLQNSQMSVAPVVIKDVVGFCTSGGTAGMLVGMDGLFAVFITVCTITADPFVWLRARLIRLRQIERVSRARAALAVANVRRVLAAQDCRGSASVPEQAHLGHAPNQAHVPPLPNQAQLVHAPAQARTTPALVSARAAMAAGSAHAARLPAGACA